MSGQPQHGGPFLDAADYAIREKCFHNHRKPPFDPKSQLRQLQRSFAPGAFSSIVEQPGLKAMPLPYRDIDMDLLDGEHGEDVNAAADFLELKLGRSNLHLSFQMCKNLRLPKETLHPGYDFGEEFSKYASDIWKKRTCNILDEWLPVSPVVQEKDEGLEFPRGAARWQLLAVRELERERLDVPPEAQKIAHEMTHSTYQKLEKDDYNIKSSKRLGRRISPLLPSTPEPDDEFIPGVEAAVVDLTSEPSTPENAAVSELQQRCQQGRIDSDSVVPFIMPSSSPNAHRAALKESQSCKISTLKLDAPLLDSSPSVVENIRKPITSNAMEMITPQESDLHYPGSETSGYFEEALSAVLQGSHGRVTEMLMNEKPSPTDSLLRMRMPAIDLAVPPPRWQTNISNPEILFRGILNERNDYLSPYSLERITELGSQLRWTPIPSQRCRIDTSERLEHLSPQSQEYLSLKSPHIGSQSFIVKPEKLRIFRVFDDEEVELERNSDASPNQPRGEEMDSESRLVGMTALDDIIARSSRKRKVTDVYEAAEASPPSNDSGATCTLLSSFMELRNAKKRELAGGSANGSHLCRNDPATPQQTQATEPTVVNGPQSSTVAVSLQPAPVPEMIIPQAVCRFIISVALGRTIVSELTKLWPEADLIDRDFSQDNTVSWSPNSCQRKEVFPETAWEADVVLSPSAGIIVTTMLKVKQQPLPGSSMLTPLRERTQRLAQKYENLIVLVSESNPQGEYCGVLSPADWAAYADFVRFTTTLQAGVTTHFVPGAGKTQARWIVAMMCKLSAPNAQSGRFLSHTDMTWSMTLRRAGMNIAAAQVLEGLLLAEYGNAGLMEFLVMPRQDRLSKYAQVMGGERVLGDVSQRLDRPWM